MTKDEVRFSLMCEISMALKSPKLQQGFEIICKNLADLKKENAELNDKLNNLASVAKVRLANWQKYADAYNETQELLDKQIEATYKVVEENKELKEKLNKATEILKVVLNKWKEERWILQSEKEVKMIENVMKEAEAF